MCLFKEGYHQREVWGNSPCTSLCSSLQSFFVFCKHSILRFYFALLFSVFIILTGISIKSVMKVHNTKKKKKGKHKTKGKSSNLVLGSTSNWVMWRHWWRLLPETLWWESGWLSKRGVKRQSDPFSFHLYATDRTNRESERSVKTRWVSYNCLNVWWADPSTSLKNRGEVPTGDGSSLSIDITDATDCAFGGLRLGD